MRNWQEIKKNPADRKLSPLGWSIGTRLLWATGASGILWLAVAWALGRG